MDYSISSSVALRIWIRMDRIVFGRPRIRIQGGQKWPKKIEQSEEISYFGVLDILCLLRTEGLSYSLDVLYGSLEIKKLPFFSDVFFLQFFVFKTLYPEPDRHWPKMLDPYPPYPQHWSLPWRLVRYQRICANFSLRGNAEEKIEKAFFVWTQHLVGTPGSSVGQQVMLLLTML